MDYKSKYDIFICGGTQHFAMLQALLPLLHPFGTIHLGSIVLTAKELKELRPYYDVLHQPRYHEQGYRNFELFCIRDINRLASAPHFIKLDADIYLRSDWVNYVDRNLSRHNEAVLFGPDEGFTNITMELSGRLVEQKLGRTLSVSNGRKVTGGFYVGQTAFFKRHDQFMQAVHELLYCFRDGQRIFPSPQPEDWPDVDEQSNNQVSLRVTPDSLWGTSCEDVLRSLVVHAQGAGDRLFVFDDEEKIRVTFPSLGLGKSHARLHSSLPAMEA